MSSRPRKRAVPLRRRTDDEGDEEHSPKAEFEDDSLSDISALSNEDEDAVGEISDASGEANDPQPALMVADAPPSTVKSPIAPDEKIFKSTADMEAMMNGVKESAPGEETQEIRFDSMNAEHATALDTHSADEKIGQQVETSADQPKTHQDYIRQRDSNPAFVPNRGGFFLHDDRTAPHGNQNFRGTNRTRAAGGPFQSRGQPYRTADKQPWAHDLHESLSQSEAKRPLHHQQNVALGSRTPKVHAKLLSGPNRSFSSSVVLGNVTVRISLPGMDHPGSVPNIVKRHHTLLPQHRPPLRRDKPVRISIPDQTPRYIFPSVERSFIFIPRALRPNQQPMLRGRGRGSFQGSRRPSIFGGSVYTPSVAMSRKSSFGPASRERSPSSTFGSNAFLPSNLHKPIVRLPAAPPIPTQQGNGIHLPLGPPPYPQNVRETHVQAIPIHQPRPKKTVSVADIDVPMSLELRPPQQEQEQPFHQQVPQFFTQPLSEDPAMLYSRSRRQSHAGMATGTPLSQIPERAIYAQPFQPYPVFPQQAYYPMPYPAGPNFYHMPAGQSGSYPGSVPTGVLAPPFVPGHPSPANVHQAPPQGQDGSAQPHSVPHESNGMVYYYNPTQYPPMANGAMSGFAMGPGGMTPPMQFFYPPSNGMFFPPQ